MASLKAVSMFAVLLFSLLSILLFVQHELHSMNKEALGSLEFHEKTFYRVIVVTWFQQKYIVSFCFLACF